MTIGRDRIQELLIQVLNIVHNSGDDEDQIRQFGLEPEAVMTLLSIIAAKGENVEDPLAPLAVAFYVGIMIGRDQ
jgi:hypothetical protein